MQSSARCVTSEHTQILAALVFVVRANMAPTLISINTSLQLYFERINRKRNIYLTL